MNRTCLAILTFLCLAELPATAAEEPTDRTLSPYFFVEQGDRETDRLPLEETNADVRITGVIADVVVTQVYRNEGSRPINARYVFPASTRAAVHGMTLTVGEHRVRTQIKERQIARQQYERAQATHEPQLAARRLEMEVDVPTGLTVMGNAFLLHQAVANLLQNAIDFSPAGGKVTVAAAPDQNQVTLTVTDDGPGVPEYARSRIFERFYSLARPDTGKKSTGLGLNLVREVAQLHDGSVRVANCPGRGATAEIRLPRAVPG